MALVDALLQLSDAQAITTTAASTNVIDMLAEGQALEPGCWARFVVQTAFSGGTNLQVQLQSGDSATMANGVTLAQSAAIPDATLVAGYEALVVKIPKNCKRFIRGYYIDVGSHSAGKMDAHIVQNVDTLITDVEPA